MTVIKMSIKTIYRQNMGACNFTATEAVKNNSSAWPCNVVQLE